MNPVLQPAGAPCSLYLHSPVVVEMAVMDPPTWKRHSNWTFAELDSGRVAQEVQHITDSHMLARIILTRFEIVHP